MKQYQADFVHFCIENGALVFGDFALKSGRRSPYFFNSGVLCTDGTRLTRLALFYAAALDDHYAEFSQPPTMVFGPAYKGIPLACSLASAYVNRQNLGIVFNRKEAKDHGEAGSLVGRFPTSSDTVLVIDDVITAGTAILEALPHVLAACTPSPKIAGVLIALDRQEYGPESRLSATQELAEKIGAPVFSIISLDHVLVALRNSNDPAALANAEAIENYRKTYSAE